MNGGFKCQDCRRTFLFSASMVEIKSVRYGVVRKTVERRVCPHCLSMNFERVENNAKIRTIEDVSYDKANALIEKGFEVSGMYSNHVVLVQR